MSKYEIFIEKSFFVELLPDRSSFTDIYRYDGSPKICLRPFAKNDGFDSICSLDTNSTKNYEV